PRLRPRGLDRRSPLGSLLWPRQAHRRRLAAADLQAAPRRRAEARVRHRPRRRALLRRRGGRGVPPDLQRPHARPRRHPPARHLLPSSVQGGGGGGGELEPRPRPRRRSASRPSVVPSSCMARYPPYVRAAVAMSPSHTPASRVWSTRPVKPRSGGLMMLMMMRISDRIPSAVTIALAATGRATDCRVAER